MRFGRAVFIAVALTLVVIAPLWAHHSIPPTFQDTYTDIQAVVTEVRMSLPHAWLMTEVKGEKGETHSWYVQTTGLRTREPQGRRPHRRLRPRAQ